MYQFGPLLPFGPLGQVDAGPGKTVLLGNTHRYGCRAATTPRPRDGVGTMTDVRLATHLGENADEIARELARSIGSDTGFDVDVVPGAASQQRGRWSVEHADIYWLCGLLTIELIASDELDATIVAAPVFPERPGAVYSSVIVARDATFATRDVANSTLVINEAGSWSGNHALRVHADRHGWEPFEKVVTSASHLASLEMLLAGEADVAAIDDTIWEYALARDRRLDHLEVVDRTQWWPAPPFSVRRSLPIEIAAPLEASLLSAVPQGLDGVVSASGHDYEPIRTAMAASATSG